MKKDINPTKLKIQQTALDLFSEKGYRAVSIRDIGKVVGIKESSIYYHFTNKQEIFDELLKEVTEITERMKTAFHIRFETITQVKEAEFILVGLGVLKNYLIDSHILKFIRMLLIEQHGNPEAALLYQSILFDAPLKQNQEAFQTMMDKGIFKKEDPNLLAAEYYGMIYFVFQKYFSNKVTGEERQQKAEDELIQHLKRFYNRYHV